MSSKDLQGIDLLDQYWRAGIDSIKVEGRMKGPNYLASVISAYSQSLRYLKANGELPQKKSWQESLNKVSSRDQTHASLLTDADETSIYDQRDDHDSPSHVVGVIRDVVEGDFAVLEVRRGFTPGIELEILNFNGETQSVYLDKLYSLSESEIAKTKPGTYIRIPYASHMEEMNLVRML